MLDEYRGWLPEVKKIAVEAGREILSVYNENEDIAVDVKSDNSPVTKADRAGHKVIVEGLSVLTPDIPVLSEEGALPAFDIRRSWNVYWIVDPLDGTKEFINRNGEFTVNIALIMEGKPVLGVVYVPVKDVMYSAAKGHGAFKEVNGSEKTITVRALPEGEISVVASRRHGAEALEGMLQKAAEKLGQVTRVSMGSSLKICLLAEGEADWYPRLALTSEWDTAAAHAVLDEAGGVIVDADNLETLNYNQKDDILNPFFHAFADTSVDWKSILA